VCIDRAAKQFQEQGYVLEDIKAIGITNQRETTVYGSEIGGRSRSGG